MQRTVPLGQPTVGEPELAAVAEVFASGWLSGAGPTCVAFENEFARAVPTAHALTTANCGSALHLALQVLVARSGADEDDPARRRRTQWVRQRAVHEMAAARRPNRGPQSAPPW